ncbi:lysozyme inhibitor LprI family protein [Aureimonas ureilytica]|uniref:lysozyme inhibitor LprI family protein n=1 Tax=Aureimonas ureilytica TaxID=401562 RepID=UPI003CFB7F57
MNRTSLSQHMGGALVLALALLSSVPAAHALDCEGAADQTSLNLCAGRAYSEADRRLNELYRDLKARLKGDPNRLGHLTSAQRAWIGFRDLECEFRASAVQGGSAQPMVKADCLRDLTERRIEALRVYAHCPEGDLGCPVPPPTNQSN